MDQQCCTINITPTDSGVKIDFTRSSGAAACCCCVPGSETGGKAGSSCCDQPDKKE